MAEVETELAKQARILEEQNKKMEEDLEKGKLDNERYAKALEKNKELKKGKAELSKLTEDSYSKLLKNKSVLIVIGIVGVLLIVYAMKGC
jgi:lipid II:glycine glycyltransferase (peptidoglycan interpeptide bridge formation enzyme)